MNETTPMAELRLALVCYGGVSLAVYMHGVTKELHKFMVAARAFDECHDNGSSVNPFRENALPGTEAAYFDALQDLSDAGMPLRVSIDIIGGTSAGGINGIALSKAMAIGADLEPLKDVWIRQGDIRKLLRGPAFPTLVTQALITAARQAVGLFSPISPLRGEYMSTLLLTALEEMDDQSHGPSLLPDGGKLELFVPTTDLDGYDVLVPSGAGGASQRDHNNAQILEFDSDKNQFDKVHTRHLAFAGRASSSFPGAFAPVSPRSFGHETNSDYRADPNMFRYRHEDDRGRETQDIHYVDGGVLDNAPFDVVISAISRRPAETEVHRRLVYIQPDPRGALDAPPDTPVRLNGKRRYLKDLLAVSKVKGSHSIVRDLFDLRDMNGRIDEVSAIAKLQMKFVLGQIDHVLKGLESGSVAPGKAPTTAPVVADPVTPGSAGTTSLMSTVNDHDTVQALSNEMHRQAHASLEPTWTTYQRLKFKTTLHRLVSEICRREDFRQPTQSGQASFMRAVFVAWARNQGAWTSEKGVVLGEMLRSTDAPYRERRLMFILAGINEMYGRKTPPPEDLNKLKAQAWELLRDLQIGTKAAVVELPSARLDFLRSDDPKWILADPAEFAADHDKKFDVLFKIYSNYMATELDNGGKELWVEFEKGTRQWSPEDREELLARYLGFPLWDGIIFPTIALTEVPQLSPIGVSQFSPPMATTLTPVDANGRNAVKLKGIPFMHFAGFFDEASRQNDYLWGRLDGAELILRLLQDLKQSKNDTMPIAHLVDALDAVLSSETDLDRITEVRGHLEDQVQELAKSRRMAPSDAPGPDGSTSPGPLGL